MRRNCTHTNDKMREGRLLAYTLVAGAAALHGQNQQTVAAIEYFDIDDIAIGQGVTQSLDINGDTQTDILLKNQVFVSSNYQGASIPYVGGRLMATRPALIYITALTGGEQISPSTISPNYSSGVLAYGVASPYAEFNNVTDGYIGFSFAADSGTDIFYAWVRVDINNAAGSFVIKDFAFENVPGIGILAGATTGGGLPGDLDSDGFVGITDLNLVLGNWNQNVTVGDPLQGDPSGDGFVGIEDLNEVLGNWNAGTPPTTVAAVPEPGALSFLAAGAAGVSVWRRRRR
jgi:hypothetical protein